MTAVVLGRGLAERLRAAEDGTAAVLDPVAPEAAAPEDEPPAPAPEGPAPGRLRRIWIVPAAVLAAGAVALLPTVGGDGLGAGEAEVHVSGRALVVSEEGREDVVTDDTVRIGPGDTLEVLDGRVALELADDVALEGHAGAAGDRSGTTVVMGAEPELLAGRLLAVAPVPLDLRAGASRITVAPGRGRAGAARLERRLGLGVSAYAGRVAVDSAGQSGVVAPLHRLDVAAVGTLGRRDLPLSYDADDPWDRRFLGDALLVDRQLEPLLVGLEGAADDLRTATGLRAALPDLAAPALAEVADAAASGPEALVAAVLADVTDGGTFASRAQAAQEFRDDGARWGLVALDRGAEPAPFLAAVRAAVDRVLSDPAAIAPDVSTAPDEGPDPAGPDAAGTTTPGGTRAGDGGAQADPTTPGTTTPPEGGGGGGGVTSPTPPTLPPTTLPPLVPPSVPLPPLPPLPPPSEAVGGVVEGVGGVLGGVVEGVGGLLEGTLGGATGGGGGGDQGGSGGAGLGGLLGR